MNNPTWPSDSLVEITQSDTTVYSPALRWIYVGTTGDISVTDVSGNTVLFKAVPATTMLGPFFVASVNATGTSASNLVGFA